MNDVTLLAGSLSNDLMRVANLTARGSMAGAQRFLQEAKRWAVELKDASVPDYIADIATKVSAFDETGTVTMDVAETFLMYGVLLQNFTLHFEKMKGT